MALLATGLAARSFLYTAGAKSDAWMNRAQKPSKTMVLRQEYTQKPPANKKRTNN